MYKQISQKQTESNNMWLNKETKPLKYYTKTAFNQIGEDWKLDKRKKRKNAKSKKSNQEHKPKDKIILMKEACGINVIATSKS